MVTLQQHFSSMEQTVRSRLQNQDSLDRPKVDPLDLMKAYKDKLLEEMWKQQDNLDAAAAAEEPPLLRAEEPPSEEPPSEEPPLLRAEEPPLLRAAAADNPLLERLRALEAQNSALSLENDNQRKQYERCLDKVANQVVQALLTQKDLKQECVKLRTRVFDLEQQNRILKVLFQQRVRTASVSQEVQRTGGARGAAAGRWSSLLSLTGPRSSGSQYSSGSQTWTGGRGSSRQSASSRDQCLSTGSVSSRRSVIVAPTDHVLGHVLKGLQHLQMSKEAAAAPHCRDCMTSNEGIYSSGVKSRQPGSPAEKSSDGKPVTAEPQASILDSDDPDESGQRSTNKRLHLDSLDISADDDKGFHEDSILPASSGLFPSPDSDNFLFLEAPTVKPGVSPTDSLTKSEGLNRNSLERHISGVKVQEQAADRKSRLDCSQRQQDRLPVEQANEASRTAQRSATRALSCVNEARQRSASMEGRHCRDQANPAGSDGTSSESPQRKPKPQFCDSARKAFILRSKSADGGQDQLKHTRSPLHQKLIKGQRPKGPTASPGHSRPSKRADPHGSSKPTVSETDRNQDVSTPGGSKGLDSVQQLSPLASPVKQSKILKSPGIKDGLKSPTKPATRVSSNDGAEGIYDNLPSSPRKQRRQEDQGDPFRSEPRSPSPPLPPGRTASLLLKAGSDSKTRDRKPATQGSATGKASADFSPVRETQQSNTRTDNQPADLQRRDVSLKTFLTDGSKVPHLPVQESQSSDSVQPDRISLRRSEDGSTSQIILQRSQQSISEPKLSEVLPTGFSNVSYHGVPSDPHTSSSSAVKRSLPANAKSHEAISGQNSSTFLIFGRQSHDGPNSLQTFQTFACDPQVMHDFGSREKSCRKIETRCSSLDSEPLQAADGSAMLDWGFDEQGWLFKRSVSVSTRPLLQPAMGMNGAKARSQSFGARYLDRPSFNRSGKLRTQTQTHSGSSLNSLGDVLPGSMSCSSSYHCPMNRSLLNNFLMEEGLTVPSHLGSSSERLQSLKQQARRLQIEQQFSGAFGEPVSEEPERQSAITTIEEKVMLGIQENLHKSQEHEKTNEVKQRSGSSIASWFGFRRTKLPSPSNKKTDPPKAKDEKQKITSLLGGKSAKADKKRDRRKSDGKESSVGMREPHDAVRSCISMPCPGMSLTEIQGHASIIADPQMMNRRPDGANGSGVRSQDAVTGSRCAMRTLDSGIGTIPLPESCSFFSSILSFLPKSSSTPEPWLSPPSAPGSSSGDASPLPRWRVPSGGRSGLPASLSDSPMIPPLPFPTVAFLQPDPTVTPVCDPQSRLPRPPRGGTEPKKPNHIQPKPRPTANQPPEQSHLQLAN